MKSLEAEESEKRKRRRFMKKRAFIPVGVGACIALGLFANVTGTGKNTAVASVKDVVSSDNNFIYSMVKGILPEKGSAAEKADIIPSFSGALVAVTEEPQIPAVQKDVQGYMKNEHSEENKNITEQMPAAVLQSFEADNARDEVHDTQNQPAVQFPEEKQVQSTTGIEDFSKEEENAEKEKHEISSVREEKKAEEAEEVEEVEKAEEVTVPSSVTQEEDKHEHVLKPVYKTLHHDAVTHTETEYVETGFESSGGGSTSYGDITLSFGRHYSGKYDEDGSPVYDKYEKYFYINGEKASEEEYNEASARLHAEAEANGEIDKIEENAISGIWPRVEEIEKEIVDQEAYDEEVLDHYECEHCDEIADNI